MTTIATTARPYAVAAFEAAKAADQLSVWSSALKQLSLVVSDSQMQSLLKNPLCSKQQLSEILVSLVLADVSEGQKQSIDNFIRLLAENKRLALLPEISILFEAALEKESGYLSLSVTSAFEMDEAQRKQTEEKLSSQFNSKLNLVFNVDKEIIGGLLVRSGNWVLDDTVKSKLKRLKSALI